MSIGIIIATPDYLGVQQCFGVVYHELTTLRQVYFTRAALAARVLALKLTSLILLKVKYIYLVNIMFDEKQCIITNNGSEFLGINQGNYDIKQ